MFLTFLTLLNTLFIPNIRNSSIITTIQLLRFREWDHMGLVLRHEKVDIPCFFFDRPLAGR